MTRTALLLSALLLPACPEQRAPVTPEPVPPVVIVEDEIETMCLHLQRLGCAEGDSVYNDELPGPVDVPNQSCQDFYRDIMEDGIDVNPRCVSKTPTCDEVEDYRGRDPETC